MPIPLIAYAAFAGLQVLQSSQQASAIQRQAELARKMEEFNIEQAEIDAFKAEADGYTMQARYQSSIDQLAADQKVRYMAAGVDPTFGTASDVQEESDLIGKLNLIDIQNQARQRALGYKKEALQRRGQSGMNQLGANLQAETTRSVGYLNAIGTMFNGVQANGGFRNFTGYESKPKGHFGGTGIDERSYNVQFGGYTSQYLGDIGK